MKCLPSSKLPLAKGNILHDWHAEVLAIRAFNRFLLDQCRLISTPPHSTSDFVRQTVATEQSNHEQQPFTIREDVQIHMYCSEAPCGDASMELIMEAQEDATPWTTAPPTFSSEDVSGEESPGALRGRANFSLLGAVRCKPSRSDAPPTLSKSCTDKLALKQATSLLSSTAVLLISPRNAYIHSLVLPSSQYVPSACERAFSRSGRLQGLTSSVSDNWEGGHRFQPFQVKSTDQEFIWSRRSMAPGETAVASNLSAVWTPGWQETLIGGVLQGKKQMDPRGASRLCRRSVWKAALQVAALVGASPLMETLSQGTYKDVKESAALLHRRHVKLEMKQSGLSGWILNIGDDGFSLETPQNE